VVDNLWTAAEDAALRQGWADGVPTNELARRIGRTKNAVIGRVHRLKLPPRPSPICGPVKPIDMSELQALREAGHSIAVLAKRFNASKNRISELLGLRVAPQMVRAEHTEAPVPLTVVPSLPPEPLARLLPLAWFASPVTVADNPRQCRWLEGDAPFLQCADVRDGARSYCRQHCKRAYHRICTEVAA
jgi:GcrA cell cycle regulator